MSASYYPLLFLLLNILENGRAQENVTALQFIRHISLERFRMYLSILKYYKRQMGKKYS